MIDNSFLGINPCLLYDDMVKISWISPAGRKLTIEYEVHIDDWKVIDRAQRGVTGSQVVNIFHNGSRSTAEAGAARLHGKWFRIDQPEPKRIPDSCPKCGHVGRFIRMALCCPQHGAFGGC